MREALDEAGLEGESNTEISEAEVTLARERGQEVAAIGSSREGSIGKGHGETREARGARDTGRQREGVRGYQRRDARAAHGLALN